MPRVKADSSETRKRAPRKRAVRRTISSDEIVPRVKSESSEVVRKAPSRIAINNESRIKSKKPFVVVGIVVVSFVLAAVIGNSDAGQINITEVIDERNKQIASGLDSDGEPTSEASTVIPVQSTAPPSVPNAGLRGRGVGTAPINQPKVEVPIASSTATSTATSTDEISDESNATSTDSVEEESEEAEATTTDEISEEVLVVE